jgi:hypothetical protein
VAQKLRDAVAPFGTDRYLTPPLWAHLRSDQAERSIARTKSAGQ